MRWPVRVTQYTVVVVLSVLCPVWEAFLVPLRVEGVPVPASVLLAVTSNLALGHAGARVTGRRWGCAVPQLLWCAVVLTLAAGRPEGDVILPATVTSAALLVAGALSAATAVAFLAPKSVGRRKPINRLRDQDDR